MSSLDRGELPIWFTVTMIAALGTFATLIVPWLFVAFAHHYKFVARFLP